MKNNVIPRHFYGIKCEMLIATSENKPGDIISISKNDFGYLGYNPRTNRYFYTFVSMLRNPQICKIVEVIK